MDSSLPITVPLQNSLYRYRVALKCLDLPKISLEQALEILLARDALQNVLKTQERVAVDILSQVMKLDLRLKRKAYRITQVLSLPDYWASFPEPPQQWWWNLETTGEPHPLNRFDSLCRGIRGFVWTVDLGLIATLATRLLSGGSGLIEIVAIAVPSTITLFQVNNELTAKGHKQYEQLLDKLSIKQHWHEKIKLIPPVFLLISLGIVWHHQPEIAECFNQEGFKQQKQGQLVQAEQNYLKAIAFDSENLDANYNLGILYEDLQDFDNARKFYAIAAKGGLPDAYNNLARIYILQNKYSEAVMLLNEGQVVVDKLNQEAEKKPENLPQVQYSLFKNLGWARLKQNNLVDKLNQEAEKKPENLPQVQYSLFKNLGWARLKQNNLEEAEDNLNFALGIVNDSDISNPSAVYCLLAQLKEQQKHNASKDWQKCQDLIKNKLSVKPYEEEKKICIGKEKIIRKEMISSEEDTWFQLAKKQLKLAKRKGAKS